MKRIQMTALMVSVIWAICLFASCAPTVSLTHYNAVPATCTEAGNIEFWQDNAGACFADDQAMQPVDPVISALGHDYELYKVVGASICTEEGKRIKKCRRCGDISEEEIAPSEHTFYAYQVTVPATCTEDGQEQRVCAVCNIVEKRTIPASGHLFGTDNICSVCSFEIVPTEGLVYNMTDSNGVSGYTVTGGEANTKEIVIAKYFNGLPIVGVENGAFFEQTELRSVNIYADLTFIGQSAFRDCISLRAVAIPDSVQIIGAYAFYACTDLKQLHIGSGVTEIGQSAFFACYSLREITVSEENSVYRAEGNCLLENETLILGSNSAQIPSYTTKIGMYAFYGMESLKKVTLPSGITEIAAFAFYDCIGLSTIIYEGTTAQWGTVELGKSWCNGEEVMIRCLDGDISVAECAY